jgi:phage shock protein PspC (stress-responsive transcriptional regulator)
MAHYAELDTDNRVIRVLVVANDVITTPEGTEDENLGKAFLADLLGGTWVQTSYSGRIRGTYAGIGYTYDPIADVFISPDPEAIP